MPTPVKYANDSIRSAYKNVEANAEETLLLTLPADLRPTYEAILHGTDDEDDVYLRDLVKAADKISALIKCIDEAQAGNAEFRTAERSTRSKVDEMAARMMPTDEWVAPDTGLTSAPCSSMISETTVEYARP